MMNLTNNSYKEENDTSTQMTRIQLNYQDQCT